MVATRPDADKPFYWCKLARRAPVHRVAKHVLLVLALHADKDGTCFPRVITLARETGWTTRSVQIALRELESKGPIQTLPGRRRGTDRQGSNVYRLLLREQ